MSTSPEVEFNREYSTELEETHSTPLSTITKKKNRQPEVFAEISKNTPSVQSSLTVFTESLPEISCPLGQEKSKASVYPINIEPVIENEDYTEQEKTIQSLKNEIQFGKEVDILRKRIYQTTLTSKSEKIKSKNAKFLTGVEMNRKIYGISVREAAEKLLISSRRYRKFLIYF